MDHPTVSLKSDNGRDDSADSGARSAIDRLRVAPAQSEAEVERGLLLATSIFEEVGQVTADCDNAAYMSMIWREDPSYVPDNILLATLDGNKPVGLVRVLSRTLFRDSQTYSVAGISNVCIEREHEGMGLSVPLMWRALEICKSRGYELALLCARRAVDHYYPKFGFHGVAAYSDVSIRYPASPEPGNHLSLGDIDVSLIDIYSAAYDSCYSRCFGRLTRSPQAWRLILKKLVGNPMVSVATIFDGCRPVGYALWNRSRVLEIAYLKRLSIDKVVSLLQAIPIDTHPEKIDLDIPEQHALIQDAYGLDMRLSARECTFGGQMVRILDVESVLEKARHRGEGDFSGLHSTQAEVFNHHETCHLLGCWSPTVGPLTKGGSFPLNISLLDQF
jgi:predicted N-acetyltransferase YhbS